jgi:hypothetical protein
MLTKLCVRVSARSRYQDTLQAEGTGGTQQVRPSSALAILHLCPGRQREVELRNAFRCRRPALVRLRLRLHIKGERNSLKEKIANIERFVQSGRIELGLRRRLR